MPKKIIQFGPRNPRDFIFYEGLLQFLNGVNRVVCFFPNRIFLADAREFGVRLITGRGLKELDKVPVECLATETGTIQVSEHYDIVPLPRTR